MVGAGIVGTAIAARLAVVGLDVVVLDRFGPAAGTSSSGEGNLLVSDKLPGPELALTLRGLELWDELGAQAGARIEFEKKGGLVVAYDEAALRELCSLATAQRAQGASLDMVGGDALQDLEPALSRELQGGVAYAQDAQVQPMLAVAFQVSELVKYGGRVIRDVDVIRAERDTNEVISALVTSAGKIQVGEWVVNAAGPWAGDLARRLGADIPVIPRRGHVLVTEPLPPLVRRKVFEADYVGSVHQSDAQWACSSVIEATAGGTMLLGSSREAVGFASGVNPEIVATIARRAVVLVPQLAPARLMRAYVGFRPATPDRLPVIGPDPKVGRLLHATGHEGAGVGLALVTAELVQNIVLGETPVVALDPFAPGRFQPEPTVPGWAPSPPPVPPVNGPALGAGADPNEAEPNEAEPNEADPNERALMEGPPAEGWAPHPRPVVEFRFDGRRLTAPAGMTVAGALLAHGERAWRTARRGDQRRGLFCGIGTCFDCLVDVNGEQAVRACLRPLSEGDDISSSLSLGNAGPPGVSQLTPEGVGMAETGPPKTGPVDVVVVGGGPAGMAAAAGAAARGASVALVDSSARLGGQYFRQPLVDDGAGSSPAGPGLPARFHGLVANARVELRLACNVWSATRTETGFALLLDGGPTPLLRSRAVVLATGASELTLPFPGWELPGVMTAGAAQALLKSQKLPAGSRVVVAGTGPFLLPVAATLAKTGARVTAVEAARPRAVPRALPGFAARPAKLVEAAGYGWSLAGHRVRFLTGRAVIRCEGTDRAERAVVAKVAPGWTPIKGSERTIDVDAVCVSYGFVPRLELARQLGADVAPPTRDVAAGGVACNESMASSTPGLFVAGELAGVAGAEVAELEGELAGRGGHLHRATRQPVADRAAVLVSPAPKKPGVRQLPRRRVPAGCAVDVVARRLDRVLPVRADDLGHHRIRGHPGRRPRSRSAQLDSLRHGLLPGSYMWAGATDGNFSPHRPSHRSGR